MPGITVPDGTTAITIGTDGTVSATIPGQTEPSEIGQIQVASFPNTAGLQEIGDNYLVETAARSEEHTSELQSLMRISYAVFCLKKKIQNTSTYDLHANITKEIHLSIKTHI